MRLACTEAEDRKARGSRYLSCTDPAGDDLTSLPACEPTVQALEISRRESILRDLVMRLRSMTPRGSIIAELPQNHRSSSFPTRFDAIT